MADVRVRFIGGAEVVLAGVERVEGVAAQSVAKPEPQVSFDPAITRQVHHEWECPAGHRSGLMLVGCGPGGDQWFCKACWAVAVKRIEPASNVGTPVRPKVSTEVFNLVAALEQTLVRCDTCERAVERRYAMDHSFGMFTCHRCVNAHAVSCDGKPAGRNDPDWLGWEAARKQRSAIPEALRRPCEACGVTMDSRTHSHYCDACWDAGESKA